MNKSGCLGAILMTAALAIAPCVALSQDSDAMMLKVCEQGVEGCGLWTFLNNGGQTGTGEWEGDELAGVSYTINQNTKTIVIQRNDTRGPFAGLHATYTGTIDKDGLSGSFVKTQPGHSDNQTGHWFASAPPPTPLPHEIHFCGANCFTLTWKSDHYSITSPEPPGFTSTWMVERFTRFAVVLRRHDSPTPYNPNGLNITYRAQITGNGESLVNVTEDLPNGGRGPNPAIRAAWGAHLDTVPGSNEDRDARHWVQPTTATACDFKCVLSWADNAVTTLELVNRLSKLSSSSN